jgi:PadR family transcriptional regulator PadR
MADDTLLGSFEEQVLVAVLRCTSQAFGMQVRRELESVTERDIAIGAVYATLDRLEAKGFVASTRTSADGNSRRVFTVRPAGARALANTRALHDRLWQGVSVRRLATLSDE